MQASPSNIAQDQSFWFVEHAASAADQAAMATLRGLKLPKGRLRDATARAMFDNMMAQGANAEGVTFREDQVGGVTGWWCEPANAHPHAVLLHMHGGWFNLGSAASFRSLGSQLARATGLRTFLPDYRLAPEHPFPAAPQDVERCYAGLLEQGVEAVVVGGDSAGGNLALSLLASLARHSRLPMPACAFALSPVTDLTQSGPSWHSRAEADPYFLFEQCTGLIAAYLNGHDAADPLASPLLAELAQLPPLRIHVGDNEMLLDDSLRFAERAAAAGVDARAEVWLEMPHGFVGGVGQFEAAEAALALVGEFVAGVVATRFAR